MAARPEVVTFQLGSFSNFVGAHFWNVQQEQCNVDITAAEKQAAGEDVLTSGIVPSALFSEHLSTTGASTYRPRLVIADLNGFLGGSVPQTELQGGSPTTAAAWEGQLASLGPYAELPAKHMYQMHLEGSLPIVRQQQLEAPPAVSHATFQFSTTVKYFSDYMMLNWTPANHVELVPGYYFGVDPFLSYTGGWDLATAESPGSFWESLTNRYRLQLEQADSLGAVHLLVDWQTGFAGLAAATLDWLLDNVPKTALLICGNEPMSQISAAASPADLGLCTTKQLNGALFLEHASEELRSHGDTALLLSDYNLAKEGGGHHRRPTTVPAPDMSSWYTASALPGLALDSLSLPYRLEGCQVSAARTLYESVAMGGEAGPLMHALMSCPVPEDLFRKDAQKHSFLTRMWDMSHAPDRQLPARPLPEDAPTMADYHQYAMSRGLSHSQEVELTARLVAQDRRLCHPDPTPIPIPFPQFFNRDLPQDVTEVSTLTCLRAPTHLNDNIILSSLLAATDTASRQGTQSSLTARWGIDRDSVISAYMFLRQLCSGGQQIAEESDQL